MSQYHKGRNRQTLPPVSTSRSEPSFADGLLVSSMTVPPQRQANGAIRKLSIIHDLKPKSGGGSPEYGARKEELERQLKEKERIIKEKDKELRERIATIKFKDQEISNLSQEKLSDQERIAKLEKECQNLKQTIKTKEADIQRLQSLIDSKKDETDYKPLYEAEKSAHKETTDRLSMCQTQIQEKERVLQELRLKHKSELDSLRKEMEETVASCKQKYEDEIRERDQKIVKLKKQMADAFTGNSMERQQQIDELTKELTKVQGECDAMRIRAKHTGGHKNGTACENCKNLKAHLEKKDTIIKEKNRTLDELNIIVGRYEAQLKQQEELLKQWQDVKDDVKDFLDRDEIRYPANYK